MPSDVAQIQFNYEYFELSSTLLCSSVSFDYVQLLCVDFEYCCIDIFCQISLLLNNNNFLTTLIKLHWWWLGGLTSYLYNVDATNHKTLLCNIQEHDTTHFFTCTKLYTPMMFLDLWTDPVKVIPLLDTWRDRLSHSLWVSLGSSLKTWETGSTTTTTTWLGDRMADSGLRPGYNWWFGD